MRNFQGLKLFLVDSVELNERAHRAWAEERESYVQCIKLLSQEIKELKLEYERTSACIVPSPRLCCLFWKKNRITAEENQKIKDKCQKLKALSLVTLRLKLINRKHLQDLDKYENKRKKLQAWKSAIVNIFEQMKEKETVCKRLADLDHRKFSPAECSLKKYYHRWCHNNVIDLRLLLDIQQHSKTLELFEGFDLLEWPAKF